MILKIRNSVNHAQCRCLMSFLEPMQMDLKMKKNEEYCMYCFKDGEFTSDMSMEEMMNFCIDKMVEVHPEIDKDEASAMMKEVFPKLKRWAND